MLLEDQRLIHEDLERLEQGISDRVTEDPRSIKDRLNRDHEIAGFLKRIEEQSQRLLDIYKDVEGSRAKEVQTLSTGDPFEGFYKQLEETKDFHRRYPNEPVENLERAYKRRHLQEGETVSAVTDNMFTGEESNGRFLDLTTQHEDYLNIPGVKRITYIQYLDHFDNFVPPHLPIKRSQKLSDRYFKYVSDLDNYLESFLRRTNPLEDFDKIFSTIEDDFDKAWNDKSVSGWGEDLNGTSAVDGPKTEGTGSGIWCPDCEKEFSNPNVYKSHLTGKKHIKAAQTKQSNGTADTSAAQPTSRQTNNLARLKERAIASHEHRVRSLAKILMNERSNTRVNVERKQGMTERERQQELDALFAEDDAAMNNPSGRPESDEESDGEEKIYNPLKLPLAWDGKPIPFWLYKLHGLGVEFPCEICGNFVYMGRRAFEKHFSEARHIYGLKCLGVSGPGAGGGLFREITGIEEAVGLWEKIKKERKDKDTKEESIVQMEDGEGNVMPERIYRDLQKQGIL
ncbi:MAG: hypothetical protein Q9227_003424 [Pyrenula ochraceoflavens]